MKKFEEYQRVLDLKKRLAPYGSSEVLATVPSGREKPYEIVGFCIGSSNPTHPTFGLFGGVHGLEKIGTHVALYFLESLSEQLEWDEDLRDFFKSNRLVSIPLINPTGMISRRRSNYNHVDLMRNAPIEGKNSLWFAGGHRWGPWFPWYRGKKNAPLELETQAVIDFCKKEMFSAEKSFALDLHSGFGSKDRLWYPHGTTRDRFPLEDQVQRWKTVLERSYPYHVYHIEPQSDSYVIHGDLWDYLWFEFEKSKKNKDHFFIPWTLEMGSWLWIRKNPIQLLSSLGVFNPVKPHRYQRIMRRHYFLIDFFRRSLKQSSSWWEKKE